MHSPSIWLSTLVLSSVVSAAPRFQFPTAGQQHPPHQSGWPPHFPHNGSYHHHSGRPMATGTGAVAPTSTASTVQSEVVVVSSVLSASPTVVLPPDTTATASASAKDKTSKTSPTIISSSTSSATISSPSQLATIADVAAPASTLCGTANAMDARASPTGAPWTYASDNYNYDAMAGAGDYCVGFYDASKDSSNTWSIHWSSIWNINKDKCPNAEITKGYSNLAVGKNLKKQVSAVQNMPTVWNWTATNTDGIKGCITFDFMMGPTSGDYKSSDVKELMLWLWWTGGDLPIGYAEGPVATISLFGKDGWKLYQGMNTESNQLVSSLLAPEDNMYTGNFDGDLKDWFTALSDAGQYQVYPSTYYVNVGNMGTEAWYGDVTFDFHVSGFELTVS